MGQVQHHLSDPSKGQGSGSPLRECLGQKLNVQPLGVLLVWKRSGAWHQAGPVERQPFDLDDPDVLKRWEARLEGQIYRIYGYSEEDGNAWEYLALLEFRDMAAWNGLHQRLDEVGFSTYFEWDIVAFGRRIA